MLCDEGCISSIQYEIYKSLLETRTNTKQLIHTGVPDKILYLDLRPDMCDKRIRKRGREEETPITLDYLKKCDKYYKNWLTKNSDKVVCVDFNGVTEPVSKSPLNFSDNDRREFAEKLRHSPERSETINHANHANIVFVIEQILST
jgi:deoxyadenosine/deoxycytidine kinase